ncbi:hypothetical protein ABT314_40855, partial [Streptomyces spiralis]
LRTDGHPGEGDAPRPGALDPYVPALGVGVHRGRPQGPSGDLDVGQCSAHLSWAAVGEQGRSWTRA